MKLYKVPSNSNIRVVDDIKIHPSAPRIEKNEILRFHHMDGMYSYCTNANKEVVHLVAWTEVEIVK